MGAQEVFVCDGHANCSVPVGTLTDGLDASDLPPIPFPMERFAGCTAFLRSLSVSFYFLFYTVN